MSDIERLRELFDQEEVKHSYKKPSLPKRHHHYFFAHRDLPAGIFTDPSAFFDVMGSSVGYEWLRWLWNRIGDDLDPHDHGVKLSDEGCRSSLSQLTILSVQS